MNYKFILIGVVLIFAFSACKKDQMIIPESNDPVFRLDGTFGSENISVVAGDNNGFMHTMTEMENGVEVVSGRLADDAVSIELGIYHGGLNNLNEAFDASMSLTPIFSEYHGYTLATLSKNQFVNSANISNIEWVIDDGQPIMDSVEIKEPGKYNVCAHIIYNNGMSPQTLCNEVIVGYNRYQNESINFENNVGLGGASTWINNELGTVEYVDWYYNGEFYVRADSCFNNLGNQMYELTAEVHYTNSVIQRKSMLVDGGANGATIEDFTIFEDNALNIIQDYNIRVKINNNGSIYRSDYADNSSSVVEITSVELYGTNNQGKQVYKVLASVSCNVSSDQGANQIPLIFNTSFGFEVK